MPPFTPGVSVGDSVWWWPLDVLDVDALVPTRSQIVSNYLVGKKKILKNIPRLNADASQACWCLLPVPKYKKRISY